MHSLPDSTWEGNLNRIKFWRSEAKRSLGETISYMELVKRNDGKMAVVGLAIAPGDASNIQMVMHAELPNISLGDFEQHETIPRPTLELRPLIPLKIATEHSSDAPHITQPELALHSERKRGKMLDEVEEFKVHEKSGTVLLTTAKEISVFKDGKIKKIAEWRPSSAVLNVSFCESNPEFVAFVSCGQLFIDRDNSPAFQSDASLPNVSNGIASFTIQEEFERYDGYFWSPTRPEIVYERVDVSPVTRAGAEEGTMRYIVTLRCCSFDGQQFVDIALNVDLRSVVPWMEYIDNMGWTPDGADILSHLVGRPFAIFFQANNHLHFLPLTNGQQNQSANDYSFIIGSERSDLCHLYLHNTRNTDSIAITSSTDWPIIKGVFSKVDTQRNLVFFLANRISPILLSLCVSNYSRPDGDCRVLTPFDMSYRFERASASLCLNPDIGFVCWVSSVQILPECRLYRLIHSSASVDPLPRAVYTHRIGVQFLSPFSGLQSASWGMSFLFRPLAQLVKSFFFEYTSANSGKIHHALLLVPAKRNGSTKFPVVHAVYAGPSIQLVRNSWFSVCHHLKYLASGYAVLMVDGRGSDNRGLKFESAIKKRMGSAEIEDQHEGMRMAAKQFGDLLDLDRVAVIGWSYGGYAALLLLACFPGTYRCACVGGAVSDWRLYDNKAYTERYMGMADENAEAYEKSALSSFVPRLPNQDGRLMIVHGMIDENVHFSHCSELISTLISAQKPHQLLLFPGERHGIRNGDAIEFYQASVITFFARAFASLPTALHQ